MGKRIKLVCIGRSLVGGGAERVQINLMRELANEVDLSVIYISGGGVLENIFPDNIYRRQLNIGKSAGFSNFYNILQLFLEIKKSDMIFSMQDTTPIYLGVLGKIILRKPIVGWVHNTWTFKKESVSRFHRLFVRLFYPLCDYIVTVSTGAKEDLSRYIPNYNNIQVIYNPIDRDRVVEYGKQELSVEDAVWFDKKVILAIGRLEKVKGFSLLITAFNESGLKQKYNLVILGDGGERKELIDQVNRLGLNEVVGILGFRDNPYSFLSKSSVFVLSSFYEGLPTVLIEAQVIGCPIVSADCPSGTVEILDDGNAGLLFKTGDERDLADKLVSFDSDFDNAAQRAEYGITLSERFVPKLISQNFITLFNRVLKSRVLR